jgi:hypothetical protein
MIEGMMSRPDIVTRDQAISRHDLRALAQNHGGPIATLMTLVEIGVVDQQDHPGLFQTVSRWSELDADERHAFGQAVRRLKQHAEALGFSIPEPGPGAGLHDPVVRR